MTGGPDGERSAAGSATEVVRIGLLAAPGAAASLADGVAPDLEQRLAARFPDLDWRVEVELDRLAGPGASGLDLVEAARDRLRERDWDVAGVLTDLPLRVDRRPVVAQASPLHAVAVLSVPALGAVAVRRRATERLAGLVVDVAGHLRGDESPDGDDRGGDDGEGMASMARVATGHLGLLLGMVRASSPWRLALHLSRALAAALATAVFALVTSDIWRLADRLGTARLVLLTVASVLAVVLTLLVGAQLWERPRSPREREQAVLFNTATTLTLALGVACLYAALLVLSLLAALLLVPRGLLADGLGRPADVLDQVRLAWLTSSLATAGGALGAGLESDDAVRRAAYGRHLQS